MLSNSGRGIDSEQDLNSRNQFNNLKSMNSFDGTGAPTTINGTYQGMLSVDELREIITLKGNEIRTLKAQIPKPSKEVIKPHVDQLLFLKERQEL